MNYVPVFEKEQRNKEFFIDKETSIAEEYSTGNSTTPITNTTIFLEAVQLKRAVRFFFKNPIEKWNERKRFPLKFIIQVIKIVLITFQLCVFAQSRYEHMNYGFNNKISFSHLFLKNWDASREVTNYPPTAGPFAIYTIDEFYESVDFVFSRYKNLSKNSIGSYSYFKLDGKIHPIELCFYHYFDNLLSKNKEEPNKLTNCWSVYVNDIDEFSIQNFMLKKNITKFEFLLRFELKFPIKTVSYKPGSRHCSKFQIEISYDNEAMDGQMLVLLFSQINRLKCESEAYLSKVYMTEIWHNVLNFSVIMVCSISFLLCLRSIYRAQILKYKTIDFFKRVKKVELSVEGRLEFWNFWYIMIIINDILIIIGSFIQVKITRNEYEMEEWSICSLCLGTGNMLVWFGVLRYFGFFKTYNVVMLTLKRAFPQMMRFLLCTLIIYAGFVFCGWLVLGPFHIKFRSISRTSENLFSLVNGDDMFATFTILESRSPVLWWYSRIYLYSFISLFIYVILNLFLSVILDAYETIKEYYLHGFPKSDLQQFITESDGEFDDNCLMENELSNYNRGWRLRLKSFFSVL